ncbi:MAG: hypothetical protein E7403_03380 [Ruminococcaceae bacterium]|nr:hypothetical protein [Oscillospiraceae bacterium]
MEVRSNLLDASALQMKNYMLLWDYQDAGFTHYCLLTEGENCDDCNSLKGQIFLINEARVGENFPPMHPNCNCRVGILNGAGQVAYIISAGKSEKKSEETNWYDAFLRMPQDAKELFLAFVRAQNERLGQKDIVGFLDWLTMGIISGTVKGYEDRYQELLDDPTLYNVVNYLTSGFADAVKGAFKPEEPLSLQHWLDTLGTVSTAFAAYQLGQSATSNTQHSVTGYADNAVLNKNQFLSGGLDTLDDLDDLLTNPSRLTNVDEQQLYDYLIERGYEVQPLSRGSFKGIPFEKGGGFKVNWGGDRILQYHPCNASHHGGAYFKISSGTTGTIRIDLKGNIIK